MYIYIYIYIYVYIRVYTLAKLSTWFFEHFGDISSSLLVNSSHNNDSWEGRDTYLWRFFEFNDEIKQKISAIGTSLFPHTPVFI